MERAAGLCYSFRMRKKSPTIATHDGKFHADDVFAVATLLIFLDGGARVVRTRDPNKIKKADYVVDVGSVYEANKNRFDHHIKEGAGTRVSGIPYASFGLVWQKFGEKISGSKEVADAVDCSLVSPTDAEDNGVSIFTPAPIRSGGLVRGFSLLEQNTYPYEVSDAIRSFVPTWREQDVSYGERFEEAVFFARKIIEGEVKLARSEAEGKKLVEAAYRDSNDKRLVVLDGDYPWKETLARFPEPLFVVHPQDGQWILECVRDNPQTFRNRRDLPELWAGLRDVDLAEVTGVPDSVFCHHARFVAVAKSKQGAIALAKLALG